MIDIVLCTDEKYAPYCATVIMSAIQNTNSPSSLHFHILTLDLKQKTRELLIELAQEHSSVLTVYDADYGFFSGLHIDFGRFGVSALLRLYMDHYLPLSCKKVIYLDCDLLIHGDLSELFEQDMNGYSISAVYDLCSPEQFKARDYEYFNSGVLMIDLVQWRKHNVAEQAMTWLSNCTSDSKYPDQDALNEVFKGNWKKLDICWNMQPAAYVAYEKNYDYVDSEQIMLSIRKPKITHFIGKVKPWHAKCAHPLQTDFLYYSCLTPWPVTVQQIRSTLSLTEKIRLYTKLPKIIRRRRLMTLSSCD